jgi:tyrosinase
LTFAIVALTLLVWFAISRRWGINSAAKLQKFIQFVDTSKVVMADKKSLLLLFERPQEPIFMGKGKEEVVFDVPDAYLTDRYRAIRDEVESVQRIGLRIPVENIAIPDMSIPMSLGRNEQFSLWIPRHRKVAAKLIDIFMGMRTISDFLSCAVYARDRVNPLLFNYTISVAIIHRPDTKDLKVPSFVESFPEKFVDSKVFAQVREEATVVADEALRRPIVVPKDYTASDLEEEHK